MHNSLMTEIIGNKIKQLRNSLNETQGVFGERFGVEQATVSRWENGETVKSNLRAEIARLAGLTEAEFFHFATAPRAVPVVGYVSAGESFIPIDDNAPGDGIETVSLDLEPEEYVSIKVRGNSMIPVYRDGDIIISKKCLSPEGCVGMDCVAKTVDGEGYVKILQKGSSKGLYRLRSYNPLYDDIVDKRLEWVATVYVIIRNQRHIT